MEEYINALTKIITDTWHNMPFALEIVGIIWAIQIVNSIIKYRLNIFGIYPRSVHGLIGIPLAPFLHANYNHIFLNSIPLFILISLIASSGHLTFYYISLTIILLSGSLIWLFGKKSIHIGASSLIMGYFGYLLAEAYFKRNPNTIILAILCLFYLSSLFLALFPSGKKNVSWEGHVFGFIAGIATMYLI